MNATFTGALLDIAGYGVTAAVSRRARRYRLRVLGPDHPDTLTTRNDLAHWRGEMSV